MLALTRKTGESITLETDSGPIVIHITKTNSTRVTVAIDAPRDVNIIRTELMGVNR